MAANTQQLRIGASDFVYAILTESSDVSGGTPSYGTVTSCPNIKSIDFDPASSLFTGFYDDGPKFAADTVGVMKLTATWADLSPTNEAALLGHTYTGGQVQKKATDQSPYVAIGWKTLRTGTNSGSLIYDYFWLYKAKARKPQVSAQTKADTISPSEVQLEFNAVSLISQSGLYQTKLRTDDTDAAAATISGFFTTVALPSANLNALGVTAAEGSTPGTIEFTFAKTGGASFSMASASITTTTCPVYLVSDGSLVAGAYVVGSAGTTVVVTFTPTTPFGGSASALVAVNAGAKDTSGIGCTPYSVVIANL
jgi:phi13 family phage major tail protein